jgi:hypothetical protein
MTTIAMDVTLTHTSAAASCQARRLQDIRASLHLGNGSFKSSVLLSHGSLMPLIFADRGHSSAAG